MRYQIRSFVLFAVAIGLLALLCDPAFAQEATPPADVGPMDLAWGAVAILLVNVVVLFARSFFPASLAPEPSTPRSRGLTRLVGLVAGLLTGLFGLAEVVPVDPAVFGALWVGRLGSGLLVAGIAMFGRDAVVRGFRRAKRKKGGGGAS